MIVDASTFSHTVGVGTYLVKIEIYNLKKYIFIGTSQHLHRYPILIENDSFSHIPFAILLLLTIA